MADQEMDSMNKPSNGEVEKQNGSADKKDGGESDSGSVSLKREVGLIGGVALIVGSMIGSGIFVSPKGILRKTESVGMSFIIWLLCAVLSISGALSYAELGTIIPKSGGEYAYLLEAFGPLPAFIFAWTYTIMIKPSIVSIISLIFGTYVVEALGLGDCTPEETTMAIKLFAIVCILLLTFVNCWSVKAANSVQIFFTAAKLLALVIIALIGFVRLGQGHTEYLQSDIAFTGSSTSVFSYSIAFYQGLWAYESWNQLNFATEELINPAKNLPRAIMIGVPLVALVYLTCNVAYFTVLSPEELLASPAVAVDFANRTLGVMAWIIPFFVCCSTFGAANGTLFAAGRIPFAAAREGHMLQILSFVHVQRFTPFVSVILTSSMAILMLLPGDFDSLVNYFSFAAWVFYGGTVLSLLVLRFTRPDLERPFKVPIICPIIFVLASIYLIIAPIIEEPSFAFFYAGLFILSGLIFYFPFVHFKIHLKCMDPVTLFLQKLFKVAPTAGYKASSD
ncbi:b(0,+)-type amino acid transporter 1-like [Amphiura filiformis]|uniref:b(0,+)-type amino acid transporter 1-like n=1 Tax=Amphiura filiformis TaxID=82378 RepID=UPI003B2235B6